MSGRYPGQSGRNIGAYPARQAGKAGLVIRLVQEGAPERRLSHAFGVRQGRNDETAGHPCAGTAHPRLLTNIRNPIRMFSGMPPPPPSRRFGGFGTAQTPGHEKRKKPLAHYFSSKTATPCASDSDSSTTTNKKPSNPCRKQKEKQCAKNPFLNP